MIGATLPPTVTVGATPSMKRKPGPEMVRGTSPNSLQNLGGEARSTIGGAVMTRLSSDDMHSEETIGLEKLIICEKGPWARIIGS